MKGPGPYQSKFDAHFTDKHFELAEILPHQEVAENWAILRRIMQVPAVAPTTTFPSYFHRSKSGEWSIAGTPADAGKLGHSFIAIDDKTLIFALWNGGAER
jgi:hypothetical protein